MIRLLRLLPGQADDRLRCKLEECSLEDVPSFEALSYAWGDPAVCESIVCMGITVNVTTNLALALRRVRLPDQDRLIWADALCINQRDHAERADQVLLMGEIYSLAKNVIIWLGEDDENRFAQVPALVETIYDCCVDLAQELDDDVLRLAHGPAARGLSQAPISTVQNALSGRAVAESSWKQLASLFARPWFTRTWCIQEVILAQKAIVLVGSWPPLSWEKLGVAASWLEAHDTVTDFSLPPPLEDMGYYNCFCMFDGLDLGVGSPADEFVKTLQRFRDFQATDGRDKVFGLVGLLQTKGIKMWLEVKYLNTTVANIYTEVAWNHVFMREDLTILSYVKHTQDFYADVEDGAMPSWVPRWDISTDVTMMDSDYDPFSACGSSRQVFYSKAQSTDLTSFVLPVKGFLFDTVISVSPVMHHGLFEDRGPDDVQNKAQTTVLPDLWNQMMAKGSPVLSAMKLARTLTGGVNEDYQHIVNLEDEEQDQYYGDFAVWMDYMFSQSNSNYTSNSPLALFLENDADRMRYNVAASRACDYRRVFWSENGFMGIGPACMEPSDVIVVLHGGRVPFVLRPNADKWYFLGECYIADIMFGEAADDNLQGWHRREERTFRIA